MTKSKHTTPGTSRGYRVLRFWNRDEMKQIEEVMGVILEELENPPGELSRGVLMKR